MKTNFEQFLLELSSLCARHNLYSALMRDPDTKSQGILLVNAADVRAAPYMEMEQPPKAPIGMEQ